MLINTLDKAVNSLNSTMNELRDEITQTQKDNETLTDSIKTLEDEQKQGYKTFNTNTHILLERSALNNLINDVDDVVSSADNVADEVNSARCRIEEVDTYTIESAEDSAKYMMKDAQKISDKLSDLLNTEDVQPPAEEGAKNA